MDAVKFLLKEHQRVRRIFRDLSKNGMRYTTKRKKFAKLCHDLIMHETIEHKTWYPILAQNKKLKKTIKPLLSEENHAEKLIAQFKKIKSETLFEEKFKKFKKAVLEHAKEEETYLFPKAKKALNSNELKEIGRNMYHYKRTHH